MIRLGVRVEVEKLEMSAHPSVTTSGTNSGTKSATG